MHVLRVLNFCIIHLCTYMQGKAIVDDADNDAGDGDGRGDPDPDDASGGASRTRGGPVIRG